VPGKYEYNPDPALAELLHTVTLEGWGNDSVGDVDQDSFHASLLIVEPAEQAELTDAFDRQIPVGNFIVTEDEHGFVTIDEYPTPHRARYAFNSLSVGAAVPGEEDATITPAGPLGAQYAVALAGRFLGHADDLDQAIAMLRDVMDAEQFWPDMWFVSDHGNPHRIDPWRP
jgi:hypothetical protein